MAIEDRNCCTACGGELPTRWRGLCPSCVSAQLRRSPNRDVLAQRFEDHAPEFVRILRRRWPMLEDMAEDAVQEAFMAACRSQVSPDVPLLMLMAKQRLFTLARRRERSRPELSTDVEPDLQADRRSDPAVVVEGKARLAEFARLPRNQRSAVLLRLAGYSYAEAADRCGVSQGPVIRGVNDARRLAVAFDQGAPVPGERAPKWGRVDKSRVEVRRERYEARALVAA